MKGVEEGITQLSSASGASAEGGHVAVWNFPIDPIKQCSETLTHTSHTHPLTAAPTPTDARY